MLRGMIPLAELLQWVAQTPQVFGAKPHAAAVVGDLYEALTGTPATAEMLNALEPDVASPAQLGWCLRASHVLWHPRLRDSKPETARLNRFFVEELAQLAVAVAPDEVDRNADRAEELVRRSLRVLGQRPDGESEAEAEDRLKQVDSVERRRVLAEAETREQRAREAREALAQKAAEEAVPKVGRE